MKRQTVSYKTMNGFVNALREIALGKRPYVPLEGPYGLRMSGAKLYIGRKHLGFYVAVAPYAPNAKQSIYGASAGLNVSDGWVNRTLTAKERRVATKLLNLLTPNQYEFEYFDYGSLASLRYRTPNGKWKRVFRRQGPCIIFPYAGGKNIIWTRS